MSLRVSLAMPVYNEEEYVAKATVLAQDYDDFELIVSDNASSDNTEAICRDLAASDPRIRYFRNTENIGAAGNYNRCFELARGNYFKRCAHDDFISSNYVGECVEALDKDPRRSPHTGVSNMSAVTGRSFRAVWVNQTSRFLSASSPI